MQVFHDLLLVAIEHVVPLVVRKATYRLCMCVCVCVALLHVACTSMHCHWHMLPLVCRMPQCCEDECKDRQGGRGVKLRGFRPPARGQGVAAGIKAACGHECSIPLQPFDQKHLPWVAENE